MKAGGSFNPFLLWQAANRTPNGIYLINKHCKASAPPTAKSLVSLLLLKSSGVQSSADRQPISLLDPRSVLLHREAAGNLTVGRGGTAKGQRSFTFAILFQAIAALQSIWVRTVYFLCLQWPPESLKELFYQLGISGLLLDSWHTIFFLKIIFFPRANWDSHGAMLSKQAESPVTAAWQQIYVDTRWVEHDS